LGVQSNETGSVFKLGEHGPAGQRLPWIYMRSGDTIRYEIDLDKGTLIIAITDPESGKSGVVVHQIDTEIMNEQEIVVGQPVRIVFAYDKRMVDETPEIDEWCATTGPRYTEELHTRLKQLNHIVEEIEAAEHEAQDNEHYVIADHASKTALPLVRPALDENGDPGLPGIGEEADAELDYTLPEGVQIFDPISGKTFVGRRWARPNEQTTLQALINGGYRLAVVEFKNGDTATLMPNFSGTKMGIQIKTHKGTVSRVLDEAANFAPLGPGHRIDVEMSHAFDGDRSVEGKMLTTPPIVVVVGVGPEAERADLPYPHDHTLEKFRQEKKPMDRDFGPGVGRRLAKAV